MMRLLIALHATLPAAVVAAMLLHVWPPAGLPPLADRPGWAMWALIGLWSLFSLVVLPLRGARLWRVALTAAGALLAVAGVSGSALGAMSATAMGVSLALLGIVCAALGAAIGPARVQAQRRLAMPPKKASPSAMSPGARSPNATHLKEAHPTEPHPHTPHTDAVARLRAEHMARAWRLRLAAQAGHAPFWLAGGLAVESFRLAHIVATGAARPSGMVALLLACLIALPAATLSNWMPRTSTALWFLAALGYAGLAVKAGLLQWTLASVLCILAACAGLWVRRSQQTRRLGAST